MKLPKNWRTIKPLNLYTVRQPRKVYCDDSAPKTGKVNVYICEKCRRQLWTRHIDDGVTPFMTKCINDKCTGLAQSCFYPADAQNPWMVHAVWKKEPNAWWGDEDAQKHHSENGGVFLYYLKSENQVIREPEVEE